MDWWEIIVLAFVQGLTEFLPVSSSGHLLAARFLFGISDASGTAFDAFLHLGTLLAVLVYFWRVWWGIARALVQNDEEARDKRELAAKLALATVPAAVAGYFFQDGAADFFRTPELLAAALLLTAGVLWWFDRIGRREKTIDRADFRDAMAIGLMQVLALLPGVSRSGVTIAAGRWRGLTRRQAARFSFLLSAPIIAGAGLASLTELLTIDAFPAAQLLWGFMISFASGLAAMYLLLKVVERMSFTPFVVYLIALAAVLLYAT